MLIYNLVSLLGVFLLLGIGWLFSKNRKRINWRLVFVGLALQFIFAIFIFYLPVGLWFFSRINALV